MLENLRHYKIFLASNSPRRREIMRMLRIPFTSVSLEGIDESYPPDLSPFDIPLYIAEKKCEAYLRRLQQKDLVITADTMVICENKTMGKPHSAKEAIEMLQFLSGKTHQVVTGVSIATKEKMINFSCKTDVRFAKLTDEEIMYYVDDFQPFDKAGAYGIQEWIGAAAVASIEGSYFNVVGLPIHRLYEELKKF